MIHPEVRYMARAEIKDARKSREGRLIHTVSTREDRYEDWLEMALDALDARDALLRDCERIISRDYEAQGGYTLLLQKIRTVLEPPA